MKNVVLDASAVLAFFNNESGAQKVEKVLMDDECKCHMHAANAIEVYYKVAWAIDKRAAMELYSDLMGFGVIIHENMDMFFQLRCGALKAEFLPLSLADTMAIALAERFGCAVLTTDKQFSRADKVVKVVQLR